VDLTPRTVTDLERPPPPRRRHGWAPALVLALVLAGVAVLLFQLLRSASLYFCNADEVGEKTSCSEGHRFRVQGDVGNMDDSQADSGILAFTLSFHGATVPVHYEGGEPSDLFQVGRAAVVEGRLQGGTFEADRILVKHDADYKAKNPDRVPGTEP
jgi:cytochrome c-type biogenesis protein CcmE